MRLIPTGNPYGKYYALVGNKPVGIVWRKAIEELCDYRWTWFACDSLESETIFPPHFTYDAVIEELSR